MEPRKFPKGGDSEAEALEAMSLGSVMSGAPQGALGLCPAAPQRPMPVASSFIVPLKSKGPPADCSLGRPVDKARNLKQQHQSFYPFVWLCVPAALEGQDGVAG